MELRNRDPILNISSFSSAQLHMQSYHKHGVVDWLLWRFNKKIPSLPIVNLGSIVGFFWVTIRVLQLIELWCHIFDMYPFWMRMQILNSQQKATSMPNLLS